MTNWTLPPPSNITCNFYCTDLTVCSRLHFVLEPVEPGRIWWSIWSIRWSLWAIWWTIWAIWWSIWTIWWSYIMDVIHHCWTPQVEANQSPFGQCWKLLKYDGSSLNELKHFGSFRPRQINPKLLLKNVWWTCWILKHANKVVKKYIQANWPKVSLTPVAATN